MQAPASPSEPPPLVPWETDSHNDLGHIAQGMMKSGHERWGFVIYRCTYDNDEAWAAYINRLKAKTERALDIYGRLERLNPHLRWTIMDDASVFDGASKDAVRQHFRTWVEDRTIDRDGAGADSATLLEYSPRYCYCIYVDKEGLQSLIERDNLLSSSSNPVTRISRGWVVLLDAKVWVNPYINEEPEPISDEDLEDMMDQGLTLEEIYDDPGGWQDEFGKDGWTYMGAYKMVHAYQDLAERMYNPAWSCGERLINSHAYHPAAMGFPPVDKPLA